mmetsp:Transcript_31266/g.50696  ORF Transcript_31266/g.50696 Transcript_31266/m.50696 type:complete len:237 (-) Transcript_31266:32-742(-)
MSQPVILCQSESSHPFMPQDSQPGPSWPNRTVPFTLFEPVRPQRNSRKRTWKDLDDEDQMQALHDRQNATVLDTNLPPVCSGVARPSIKRRKTNAMAAVDAQPIDYSQSLPPCQHTSSKNTHLHHASQANGPDPTDIDLKMQSKHESPDMLFHQLNLNPFQMSNTQNESVNEWRNSIQTQLHNARQKPSEIEQLCARIAQTSGLGRTVLLAKLRKSLAPAQFAQLCLAMNINANML